MTQTDVKLNRVRRSVEMDVVLEDGIQEMANKKTFGSFSKMCELLLHIAVKEVNRKKKKTTESHPQ